jgi:hypothetical protein
MGCEQLPSKPHTRLFLCRVDRGGGPATFSGTWSNVNWSGTLTGTLNGSHVVFSMVNTLPTTTQCLWTIDADITGDEMSGTARFCDANNTAFTLTRSREQ